MYEIEHEKTNNGILTLITKDGKPSGQRFLNWDELYQMLTPTSFFTKESKQ